MLFRSIGLIYRGPDGTFKLIHGTEELPPDRKPEDCKPISLTELFYCSMYEVADKYPALVTRYPITGVGSIYPSRVKLKSTIRSETRRKLNEQWEIDREAKVAYEFPTQSDLYGALSPHPFKLGKMGADFDGDTSSCNFIYSREGMDELENFFDSVRCYVGTDGKFINSLSIDTISYVLHNLTGKPRIGKTTV